MTDAALSAADQLGRSAALIGAWRGEGRGHWGAAAFGYVEELDFAHRGKPHLVYTQRTRAAADGRPLHAESGYWRAGEDPDDVELVIAQGIGVAEVSLGSWDGDVLRTTSAALQLTPTAKRVTRVARTYELSRELLVCTLEMATDGGDVRPHLEARLRRVG